MPNLAERAEILKLLDEVESVQAQLTPNEIEMWRHLKSKYDDLAEGSFDDKICLEVILRNIQVRNGYGMKPEEAATRKVDLPRKD